MTLTVQLRAVYDDVHLIMSTDPDAAGWALQVRTDSPKARSRWRPVRAKIIDNHLNWSTSDLTLWSELRAGDPTVVSRVFPDATPGVPAGTPMAVTWDVSDWTFGPDPATGLPYRFQFTDPLGKTHEFAWADLLATDTRPINIGT